MSFREGRERVRDCIAAVIDQLPEDQRRRMFDAISDDLVDAEVSREPAHQERQQEFRSQIARWRNDAREAWSEKTAYSVRADLRLVTEDEFEQMAYPSGRESA